MSNGVLVIGHLSIDHIKNRIFNVKDVAGGGALYAAIAANVYGNETTILSTECEDFPEYAKADMEKLGIKREIVRILGNQRRSFMEYSDNFDRTSHDHGRKIWYQRTIEQSPRHIPQGKADVMLLQAMLPELQLEYADWGKKNGYMVAADTSEFFAEHEACKLEELLKHIDLFLPSEVELKLMFPNYSQDEIIGKIKNAGVRILVEKCAEKGCNIYDFRNNKIVHIGIRNVDAKDATGAGDSFNGAFLSSFADNADICRSGKYAAAMASVCVEDLSYRGTMNADKKKISEYAEYVHSEERGLK